jgi:hypothetical protein
MKGFFAKGLSVRKIELDEVIEPEQDIRVAQYWKIFWKWQLHSWLTCLQCVVVPDIKVSI